MTETAIIAAIIAAGAALSVSILNNIITLSNTIISQRLAQRREVQKYYDEVYKELFAPIISDIFLYIDMASIPMGAPSIEQQIEVKDRSIDFIKGKLVYASPRLMSAYHKIKSSAISDERGGNPTDAEIGFLHDFIEEYIDVIAKTSIYANKNSVKQIHSVNLRLILYLLHKNDLGDLAKLCYMIEESSFSLKSHRKITSAINNYNKRILRKWNDIEKRRKEIEISAHGVSGKDQLQQVNQSISAEYENYNNNVRSEERKLLVELIVKELVKDNKKKKEVISLLQGYE